MAAPTLSSSNPSDGAVDAFLNRNIELSFGAALDSSTVTLNSVVLLDVATNDTVATSLSYDTGTFKITVSPLSVLAENTVYKIRIPLSLIHI